MALPLLHWPIVTKNRDNIWADFTLSAVSALMLIRLFGFLLDLEKLLTVFFFYYVGRSQAIYFVI